MDTIHTALGLSARHPVANWEERSLRLSDWCYLGTCAFETPAVSSFHPAPPPSFKELAQRGSATVFAASSPLVRLLAASSDVADFIGRWNRINQFVHSHRTTQLRMVGTHALNIDYRSRITPPDPIQSLFMGCVIAGAISHMGGLATYAGLVFQSGTVTGEYSPHVKNHVLEIIISPRRALPIPGSPVTDDPNLALLTQRIQQDPGDAWSLPRTLQFLPYSERSLQRKLASASISLPLLIRAVRIQTAIGHLLESRDSLTHIAHRCGFSDSAHFSRIFRAAAGIAPKDFRAIAHRRSLV